VPRTRAVHLTALLVLALLLAGCGSDDGERAEPEGDSCRPAEPEKIVPAPVPVENLLMSSPRTRVDSDGDGRDDVVTVEANAVAIGRGDGVLRLAEDGHDVALQSWADLNGDGRDDLVLADTVLPPGPSGPVRAGDAAPTTVVLVDGATPSGSHVPAAVGVRVDDKINYPWLQDLDGQPGSDFVLPARRDFGSNTEVYSGAALLAVGPGGDGRGAEPVLRLEGLTRGVAPLAENTEPETLLLSPGFQASVRFVSRPGAVLESPLGPARRAEDVLVFDENGVRKVGLQIDDRVAVWPAPSGCRS
jgi:hypothetical protein